MGGVLRVLSSELVESLKRAMPGVSEEDVRDAALAYVARIVSVDEALPSFVRGFLESRLEGRAKGGA